MIINLIRNNPILGKSPIIGSIFAGIIVGFCLLWIIIPKPTYADLNAGTASFVARAANESAQKAIKIIKVVATAYSSTPDQTDDTPFITASGKHVRDGIIANNMLPMGTKVMIPELYGDKVFVVEDRMNRRKSDYHIDIWMPDLESAIHFGVKTLEIKVLES